MYRNNKTTVTCFRYLTKVVVLVLFLWQTNLYAQQTTVLQGNGSASQKSAPQGAFRSQRGFYLIKGKEMQASGVANGTAITSIGFTIGAAQDSTTKGGFKVYLQNTTDTISRVDTAWTTVSAVTATSYSAGGFLPGAYEWQVRSNCSTSSPYSPATAFTNDNLVACGTPTGLSTTNIAVTSATFNWVAPASLNITNYSVEYKRLDSTNWITGSTTSLFYNASNLTPNKRYEWRLKTVCSGGISSYGGENFITNAVDSCSEPGTLTNGTITNTTASVSWTAATGANYYTVEYKRKGTPNWNSSLAFTNAYTFNALVAGTNYEWQVRTVCAAGTGAFVGGTDFSTTGTTVCYEPLNLSTNSITDSSAVLSWSASSGATSYDVRYRLKEAISWTNATTPMTAVHNDSLTVPNSIGAYNVAFANGSSFTYTGSGVYVAWEYSNATGRLSSANTTISTTANTVLNGSAGQDSVKYLLSLVVTAKNNVATLPSTLTGTNLRPETRFGSSVFKDSVEVAAVYALGNIATAFAADSISALIKNYSDTSHTYPVTLTVKEQKTNAIRYTNTRDVTVGSKSSEKVFFTGWLPTILETDSLIISVPTQTNENVTNNNRNSYVQNVTKSIVSYYDGAAAITQAGNGASPILLLNRYNIRGCGKVNGAKVYLSSSAKGHSVYAVLLNASKTMIAQSSAFTPDSTEVNNYHTFYFSNQPLLKNEDYYVGLAQPGGGTQYFPVGVQWEGADVRANSYFRAKLNGDSLTDQPLPGRLMIAAELIQGISVPAITGNPFLCSTNSSTTLSASGINVRYADSVISYSSQSSNVLYSANKALGTPDVFPNYTLSGDSWVSATTDGSREYLVLRFPNATPANFIDIYETSNPGAIDTIYVKSATMTTYDMIYSGTATAASKAARRFRIAFPLTSYNVSEVRIAINSSAVSGYNAIDAVSIGKYDTTATFTYVWSTGETTSPKTVTSAGTYKLTTTDANGCAASDSVNVVVRTSIVPTITTATTTFCQGDSIVLKSSQTGGNTWSTGAITDSIFVKIAGSYTVSYNDGSGCGSATSSATVVNVNPLPVVSITPGSTSICAGGSVTLDAGSGFNNYLWSNGVTTQTTTISGSGNYNVKVTNSNGCKASATVTINAGQSLSPVISGNLSFCPGGSTTLDAGTGYNTYSWSTGATTRTITVSNAGTYTVTVFNTNGCRGSASVVTSLYTVSSPVISGSTSFCANGSTTLTANSGYSSYSWSTGAATESINVNTANTYTLSVTTANGCSANNSVTVTQAVPPSPVITGALSFCGGNATVLDAGAGYSAYSWSTGATTQTISVTTVGTFTVTVTDSKGCTGMASATTSNQSSIPATPGPITGSTTAVCSSTQTYSISTVPNATRYVWTVPNGTTITSGQGSNSITVTFGSSFSPGDIIVAAANNCGQSSSLSPRILTVNGQPATPGNITAGMVTGVCGKTNIAYSITPVTSATSYTWTLPGGATFSTGVNTASITVNFSSTFAAGSICVTANNNCGSSTASCLNVSGKPILNGTIAGPASVCAKQTGLTYSIPAASGATAYTWTVPAQAIIKSGQGTNTITVNFSTKGGNVTVTATNACGTTTPQTLAVTIGTCAKPRNEMSAPQQQELAPGVQQMKAYPNPAKGIVTLYFEGMPTGNYQLMVLDGVGKTVRSNKIFIQGKTARVDLSSFVRGFYTISVTDGIKKTVAKIILQ